MLFDRHTLSGEGYILCISSVCIFTSLSAHTGKAIAQIAAVRIPVEDLLEIGPEESEGPLNPLFVPYPDHFAEIFGVGLYHLAEHLRRHSVGLAAARRNEIVHPD